MISCIRYQRWWSYPEAGASRDVGVFLTLGGSWVEVLPDVCVTLPLCWVNAW